MMIGYYKFINKAAPSLEALCTCLNQRDGWSLMWGDTRGFGFAKVWELDENELTDLLDKLFLF